MFEHELLQDHVDHPQAVHSQSEWEALLGHARHCSECAQRLQQALHFDDVYLDPIRSDWHHLSLHALRKLAHTGFQPEEQQNNTVEEWHLAVCPDCQARYKSLAPSGVVSRFLQSRALLLTGLLLAGLLLTIGLGWFSLKREQTQKINSQRAAVHLPAPPVVEPSPLQQHITVIATFTLQAGSSRGDGELNHIDIPPGALQVRLTLHLAKRDYPRYRAFLKNPDGELILTSDTATSSDGQTLMIELPARVLHNGDYLLTINGVDAADALKEVIQDYPLRINGR